MSGFPLTLSVLAIPLAATAVADDVSYPCRDQGGWCICDSPHFSLWSTLSRKETSATAVRCEALRAELQRTWFFGTDAMRWTSRCVVVLHSDAATYAAAVQQPGTRTVGCSTLQLDRGIVTFRRVDLRCDRSNWSASALPHELTHIVLADRLRGRPLPLWADEGLAVLSEPLATRRKRDVAFVEAVRRGSLVPLSTLLTQETPSAPALRDAFYGQSTLLVSLLIERSSPAEFLAFLDDAATDGYDVALQKHYALDGVEGLNDVWQEHENAAASGTLVEMTERAAIAVGVAARSRPLASSN